MPIKKYIIILLISFIFLTPNINAKTFTSEVSKPVLLEGGIPLIEYSNINSDFIERLKQINSESVKGLVDLGNSEAIYYSNDNTPGNYPDGAYVLKTSNGTYNNLDFTILYKQLLQINDKKYDLKLSVSKVYDESEGAVVVPPNRFIVALDEYFVDEHNHSNRYRGTNFHIDIFESNTNTKAKIPELVLGVRCLTGNNNYKDGLKIYDFEPQKNNTYVYGYNNGINYNNSSLYGTKYANNFIYSEGNAFFKIPKLSQEGELDLSYASTSSSPAVLFYFYLPTYEVKYQKEINNEITEVKKELKYENEQISFDENVEGYKLSYFTCNKDVTIDSKTILSGNIITLNQIKEIKVIEDLEITAHYEKEKYQLITEVENGEIDSSCEVSHNEDKSISYIPKEGYHLEKIIVDGESIDIKNHETFYTFQNIKNNHTIKVIFVINKYKIKTEVEGGYIDEEKIVNYGESTTISYYPEENYRLYKVLVDNTEVNSPREYDFINVQENHQIKVIYEKIPVVEIIKTTDKENYKENDTVKYKLEISQKEEGAIAKDVVVTDTLSENLILDEESLRSNNIEIIEVSENSFKIKIKELKENIIINYNAIVKENISENELITNTKLEIGNSEDEVLIDNKIYIPRGSIEKTITNNNYFYNDIITYKIKLSQKVNNATLHNLVLKEYIPSELELIDIKSSDLEIEKEENSFIIKIDELKNESVEIIVKARAKNKDGKIRIISSLSAEEILFPIEKEIIINIKKPVSKNNKNKKESVNKTIKTKEKTDDKKRSINTKIPMTGKDKKNIDLIVSLCLTGLIISIIIIIKKRI